MSSGERIAIRTLKQQPSHDSGLQQIIESGLSLVSMLGAEFDSFRMRFEHISERLAQGKIHLAVLGQFKRGKSSLINALLGAPLLPVSVIPLTSIPTYIKYGGEPSVRVSFAGGKNECLHSHNPEEMRGFLSRYVSEEANPGNRLQIDGVELFYDAPLLKQGVVFIDTPGIGSTHQHNTEVTLNFLPRCDAALFIVSADPPITAAEVGFLKEVGKRAVKIFFVLNKVDYLAAEDREEVTRFILKVLREKGGVDGDVDLFPVSAREALEGIRLGDAALMERSGVCRLVDRLTDFLTNEKYRVLRKACAGKCMGVAADADMQIRLAIRAFQLPAEEIEAKLDIFDRKIEEAREQNLISADLLAGEHKRLTEMLEEQAESLRRMSRAHFEAVVESFFNGSESSEKEIRDALAAAVPAFFERELGAVSALFDKRVADILGRHARKADEIIDEVRRSAAEIFDIPFRSETSTGGLEFVREPYWVMHQWKSSLSPIPAEWIDRLVSRKMRNTRIRKRIDEQISGLVTVNVENLRWATLQNLDTTFRRFTAELEKRFHEIIGMTRKAMGAALEKRHSLAGRAAEEIVRLENASVKIGVIRKALDDLLRSEQSDENRDVVTQSSPR